MFLSMFTDSALVKLQFGVHVLHPASAHLQMCCAVAFVGLYRVFLTNSMLFMNIRMVPGYLETNEKMC